MSAATPRVFQWLITQLASAAPGGVFRGMAPPGTTPPFIVIQQQGGNDVVGSAGYRLMESSLYLVKAVGPATGYAAIVTAYDAADNALQRQAGSAGGATIIECVREQPYALDELVNGELWSNLGGIYRVFASVP